jgi:hypothetical protein
MVLKTYQYQQYIFGQYPDFSVWCMLPKIITASRSHMREGRPATVSCAWSFYALTRACSRGKVER